MSNLSEGAPPVDAATPETQPELDLGVLATGSDEVDTALQPLEGLGDRPVAEHAAVYEGVLQGLSATMSAGGASASHEQEQQVEPPVGD